MESLLAIGFGILVIGVRLMMLRNGLRRAGKAPVALVNQVLKEGLVVCIIGLIALLGGIFYPRLSNTGARILIDTGASLMYLGLLSLVQWKVQRGQGTERQVSIWAWVVTSIGIVLIVAYVVYSVVA